MNRRNAKYSFGRLLQQEVIRQSGLIALAQFFVILLGFANSALLARLLGPQQFGTYQFLLTWVAVAAICGLPGMGMPLLKSTLKSYDRFYWLATRRSMIAASICAIVAAMIGTPFYWWGSAEWRSIGLILLLVAASIPIAGLENYESVLIGKQDFKTSRFLQLFASVVLLATTVLAAKIFGNAEYVYAAYLVSRFIVTAIAFVLVRRRLESCLADPALDTELLSQGWRQTILAFFILMASRLDRIVLGTLSPTLLAQYHIGTLFPVAIKNNAKVLLGVLGARWGKLDKISNKDALIKHGKILLGLGIAAFILVSLALPLIIPLLFGTNYQEAVWLGVFFSISLVPSFWNHMIALHSQIQGNGKFNQISQAIRFSISSLGIMIFSQRGSEWVVGSIVVADISLALISGGYLYMISHRAK